MADRDQRRLWYALGHFFRAKFDLNADQAQQTEVIDNINRGVEFRGTNLWVLIFATMVASLGLNVNSAAVIIGAMLISPLMGPIMGLGLSLGINDFELFKRSIRNFCFMIAVSIVTSTLYFALSPLSDAQSELLARTTPTIYDVLIAFFGGLAGIVAQSRKDRTSTVIPGVAIATALMPPLCTAGYGLATGQLGYFVGAFYLFFINTVFIAFATYAVVRFLRYDKKVFLDKQREKRVKHYMVLIMLITVIPSVVMAYRIVKTSVFDNNVNRYVSTVFNFPGTQVIGCEKNYRSKQAPSSIELLLIGNVVSQDAIDYARSQMENYGLADAQLVVRQAGSETESVDLSSLNLNYAQLVEEKNRQIRELKSQVEAITPADTLAMNDISREAPFVVGNIKKISLSRMVEYSTKGQVLDTVVVCYVTPQKGRVDTGKLREWLEVKTGSKKIKIFSE